MAAVCAKQLITSQLITRLQRQTALTWLRHWLLIIEALGLHEEYSRKFGEIY